MQCSITVRCLPLLAVFLVACASAPARRPEPPKLGFSAVADSLIYLGLRETQWGIEVWDQGRNQRLWGHNADRHFIPASNTKIVVTVAALGLLGPDWRYTTSIMVAGAPGDSAPRALVVKGSGDPTWSARFHPTDYTVLDAIADSLWAAGIRRIAGDLIIDATAFSRERVHSAWEIGDLPWYYAAPTGAFAISEGDVHIVATTSASSASVASLGFAPPVPFVNRIRVDTARAPLNVDIDFENWPDSAVFVGSMPPNGADTSRIALPDQELFAARALRDVLARKTIEVTGDIRIIRDSTLLAMLPAARTVLTWSSPPLTDIVAAILKPSQNWIAEQLLKTLGYLKGPGGSWYGGRIAERRYMIDVIGIDSTAFSLSDGSGLSAQNVLSPHAFVQLLEHARTAPWGTLYHGALPAPRMPASTLASRLAGLEGRVAAKTGTIANVNALSGYIRTDGGRALTFSILTNASGRSSAEVRRGIDALVRALAREQNWE